jgi:hypothetical protein
VIARLEAGATVFAVGNSETGFAIAEQEPDLDSALLDLKLPWRGGHPDQATARKAISVPSSSEAMVVIRKPIGRHPTHGLSFKGKPSVQVSAKAWYNPLQRARIDDFRWHDSALARAGGRTAARPAGVGRAGKRADGEAVRSSHRRPSRPVCGTPLRLACCGGSSLGHELVTGPKVKID